MISFRELVRRRYVRRGAIVFAVVATVFGSGVAYAAWTSSGSGNATTKAGTALAPVVTGGAVTTGFLYPGGTGDVVVSVSNPNPYPVVVQSVLPAGPADCGVTFTQRFPGTPVAANSAAVPITLTGAVTMSANAANTCQGLAITVPVTVTIASA